MNRPKLLIVTTVPDTLAFILKHQPRFLNKTFCVDLAASPTSTYDQVARIEKVPVHPVHMVRGIAPFADLASLLAMTRLLRQLKPDIVHSYTPKAGLITMLAAWICRVPIRVHTFTGLIFPSHKGLKKQLLIWTDRLICICASTVVPEGEGVKNDLKRFGITRKPLTVIGHGNIAGVDTAQFCRTLENVTTQSRQLIRQLNIPEDAFIFCYIGRLNRDKGITELLQAFVTLPEHARLLLVGDLDETSPISEQDIATIRAHPRIYELGFLADVRATLHGANILVLPSYREGFPNIVLQAGAMELPVIATDINGSNEIIEGDLNGWLVPARSADALHDAMLAALQTPAATLIDMGAQARRRIIERFERKRHWQRMVEFYHGLLGEPRQE